MASHIHLILGGARSGKSRHAQELATQHPGGVVYIATCATEKLDAEMESRIELHRQSRPAEWETIENEFDLAHIFQQRPGGVFLLDCLTLWLAYKQGEGLEEREILAELNTALHYAKEFSATVYIVSNELGSGLAPIGAENRAFRDLSGRANQLVASMADNVDFIVAGLPLKLK